MPNLSNKTKFKTQALALLDSLSGRTDPGEVPRVETLASIV